MASVSRESVEKIAQRLKEERAKLRKKEKREREKISDGFYKAVYDILKRPCEDIDIDRFRLFLESQEQNGSAFTMAMNSPLPPQGEAPAPSVNPSADGDLSPQ